MPPRSHRETSSKNKAYNSFSFRKNIEHQARYSVDHGHKRYDYNQAINEVAS